MTAHSLDEFESVLPASRGGTVLMGLKNPHLFRMLHGSFSLHIARNVQTSEVNSRNVLCSMEAAERKAFLEPRTEDACVAKGRQSSSHRKACSSQRERALDG